MARNVNVASRRMTAGSYGPYNLDSFTENDAQGVVFRMTVQSWPSGVETIGHLTITFEDGSRMDDDIPVTNVPHGGGANTLTYMRRVDFALMGPEKARSRNRSAVVTVELTSTITAGITVEAV